MPVRNAYLPLFAAVSIITSLGAALAVARADSNPSVSFFCQYNIRGELGSAPVFPYVQERVRAVRELRMPDLASDGQGAFTYLDEQDRIAYVYARNGRLTVSIARNSDSFTFASVEFKPSDAIRIEEAGDGNGFVTCAPVETPVAEKPVSVE